MGCSYTLMLLRVHWLTLAVLIKNRVQKRLTRTCLHLKFTIPTREPDLLPCNIFEENNNPCHKWVGHKRALCPCNPCCMSTQLAMCGLWATSPLNGVASQQCATCSRGQLRIFWKRIEIIAGSWLTTGVKSFGLTN